MYVPYVSEGIGEGLTSFFSHNKINIMPPVDGRGNMPCSQDAHLAKYEEAYLNIKKNKGEKK